MKAEPHGVFKARVCAWPFPATSWVSTFLYPIGWQSRRAMSAYAAWRHGAHAFMPRDVRPYSAEWPSLGAKVTLVDGLITDCGGRRRGRAQVRRFDLSHSRNLRAEGKKTMGYEVAEQMDGPCRLTSFYPTGVAPACGHVEGFDALERLGWNGPSDHVCTRPVGGLRADGPRLSRGQESAQHGRRRIPSPTGRGASAVGDSGSLRPLRERRHRPGRFRRRDIAPQPHCCTQGIFVVSRVRTLAAFQTAKRRPGLDRRRTR